MMKSSFVYRWRNVITRQWYIGYHTGDPQDGYICSSDIAGPAIKFNPRQWQRKILRTGTRAEMIALEKRLLTGLQARTNPHSLNRSNGNGTCYGGRVQGSVNRIYQQHPDLRPQALKKLTAQELITQYRDETERPRRLLLERFFLTILTE